MTCRHKAGDPNCSSSAEGARRIAEYSRQQAQATYERRVKELEERTPDPDKYEIVEVERVGQHLVMKVRYPSCVSCAYEGCKVMVFLGVSEAQVLRWRRIDPHFRDPKRGQAMNGSSEAPSPAARFPASTEGWADALEYARRKP